MLDLSSIPNPVIHCSLLSKDRESQACMAEMKTATVLPFTRIHTPSKRENFNTDDGQVINIMFKRCIFYEFVIQCLSSIAVCHPSQSVIQGPGITSVKTATVNPFLHMFSKLNYFNTDYCK